MKILVDGCAFSNSSQRGIQRYFNQIFLRNLNIHQFNVYSRLPLASPFPNGVGLVEIKEEYGNARGDIPGRLVSKFKRSWAPTRLPTGDVFHSTFFTQSPDSRLPEVLTVHDMIPEVMPYYYIGDVNSEVLRKRKCILSATKIIAVSTATANDLKNIYPEVTEKIEIVYHGADHFFLPVAQEELELNLENTPYVVYVGERGGYKNFYKLLESMLDSSWPKDVLLVVMGGDLSEAERIFVRFRNLETRLRVLVYPNDYDREKTLLGSLAFVFPSLHEGFGFPLLEAQALGIPVVASDIDVFLEIGGSGFIPVDSNDPSSISRGVASAAERHTRLEVIASGLENVKRFTWEECAANTARVWSRALKS